MFETCKETLDYLYSLQSLGINPGLERISLLCELLDNPQNKFRSVIVGGTNGKGSTVTFLSSILKESGLKVGSYSSPHLENFNERININGKLINDEAIAEITSKIKTKIDSYNQLSDKQKRLSPTFFEFTTAISFEYFKNEKVDIAILEVGLGGRFDAVNIVEPLLSIITNVSFDHTEYLGDTLEKIAYEKAGIIKHEKPVITGEESFPIIEMLKNKAKEKNSSIKILNEDFSHTKVSDKIFNFKEGRENFNNIFLNLEGDHQFKNASLAISASESLMKDCKFKISKENILDGLRKANIQGRLEYIKTSLPFKVLLDGAHNLGGSIVLSEYLKKRCKPEELVLMLGIMGDKNYNGMIENYINLAKKIILVRPKVPRSWNLQIMEKIKANAPVKFAIISDIYEALLFCQDNLEKNDNLCITGSLYTVGEARAILTKYFS